MVIKGNRDDASGGPETICEKKQKKQVGAVLGKFCDRGTGSMAVGAMRRENQRKKRKGNLFPDQRKKSDPKKRGQDWSTSNGVKYSKSARKDAL